MRVRHHMAMATHKFFSDKGFFYLNSPIVSSVDAEGAGEMFTVSTLASDWDQFIHLVQHLDQKTQIQLAIFQNFG